LYVIFAQILTKGKFDKIKPGESKMVHYQR